MAILGFRRVLYGKAFPLRGSAIPLRPLLGKRREHSQTPHLLYGKAIPLHPDYEKGITIPRLRCSFYGSAIPLPSRQLSPPPTLRSGSSRCQPASLRLSLNRTLFCPSRDAVLLPRLSVLPAYASLVAYTFSLSHPPLAVVSSSAQRTLFAFTFDIFVGVCRFRDCTSHQMTKPTAHTSRPCSFMG
jgi:hypothetical protein